MTVAGTGLDKSDLEEIKKLLKPLDDRLNLLEQDISTHTFNTQRLLTQINETLQRIEHKLTTS